jgi:hypothetical protein
MIGRIDIFCTKVAQTLSGLHKNLYDITDQMPGFFEL